MSGGHLLYIDLTQVHMVTVVMCFAIVSPCACDCESIFFFFCDVHFRGIRIRTSKLETFV